MFVAVCQQPPEFDRLEQSSPHIHVGSSHGGERRAQYWMSTRLNRLRELFKASNQYVHDRPPVKWAFWALYWSPLYLAFVHYGYTIKYVSGRSMQVRGTDFAF